MCVGRCRSLAVGIWSCRRQAEVLKASSEYLQVLAASTGCVEVQDVGSVYLKRIWRSRRQAVAIWRCRMLKVCIWRCRRQTVCV